MGLQFYIGGSGSGKSTKVFQDMIARSLKEEKTEFLMIVPDQFTMHTQQELCKLHPYGGIMNIDVLSFSRLAHRIFEEVGVEKKLVLDDTGKNLILRKVALEKEEELTVIGSNIRKIGYVHEVKSMISEFFQYDINVMELEELIRYSEEKGALSFKLNDLKILYEGFLSYIEDKFITTEESLDILRKTISKSEIIKNAVIVLDGFTGFTPVQNKLIQELMVQCKDVIVTLIADSKQSLFQKGEQQLFQLSQKTYDKLVQMAEEVKAERHEDVELSNKPVIRYQKNEAMAFLEKNLFRYRKDIFEEPNDAIKIKVAVNPKEEIQFVGQTIKRMIRTNGYSYRDFAVVTGNLSSYAHMVESEFTKYGIPFFLDQNRGILFHPLTELLKSALEILIYDFSYENVFHYLRTGLTGLEEAEIDRLENFILKSGMRGHHRYRFPFVMKNKEAEQSLNLSREKLMSSLEPLLQMKERMKEEKLSALPAKDLVSGLYEFCLALELHSKMNLFVEQFETKKQPEKAKEYEQIYPKIMELFDQIYQLMPEENLSFSEFLEIAEAGFSEIQVGTIPQSVDQVVIGDMERTRLKKNQILFFIGVNDGVIPGTGANAGLLSEMEREFLLSFGKELAPTKRQQIFIQRLYLYMNLTKPMKQLYISYTQTDGSGNTIRPSYLIGTIQGMYRNMEIEPILHDNPLAEMETRKDGYDDLAELMREYASGQLEYQEERKKMFWILYESYLFDAASGNQETVDFIEKMKQAAFFEYQDSDLSKEVATLVYGEILKNSVSRLEQFAKCAYAHFLKYGLRLQEREEYSFEALDMGTIFHGVLEQFTQYLETSEYTWFTFPREVSEEFIQKTIRSYAAEYGDTILYSSARNEYTITRMERILNRTVDTLQYQLKKGLFTPTRVESEFVMGDRMQVRGRIDRIDTFLSENNLYVKVVDYKSGNTKFDPVELLYGLQLQLAVYLNAAVEIEKKEHPDKNIIPAAILYYQMVDPFVEAKKEDGTEQIRAKIYDELRTNGLVNETESIVSMLDTAFEEHSDVIPVDRKKDGGYKASSSTGSVEDFSIISNYVNYKIREIGNQIMDGKIALDPYEKEKRTACDYCNYKTLCGFDKKIPGYEMRELDKVSAEAAKETMKEACEKEENK